VNDFNPSPITRWGLNALLLFSLVVALYFGSSVFLPTIFSLLLAALLWPATTWLNATGLPLVILVPSSQRPWLRPRIVRWRLSWGFACMTVVTGLVGLNLLLTLGFGIATTKLIQDLPTTDDAQETLYRNFRYKLQGVSPVMLDQEYFPLHARDSKIFQSLKQLFDPTQPYIVGFLRDAATMAALWIWKWILVMFILLFMMVEGRMLSRRVAEVFGPGVEAKEQALRALADMAVQVRTYLVWRTLINFGMAMGLGIIYYFTGLSQPWTWTLLTALLWYIPYLGPIAAGVPPVLDAFVTCDTALPALGLLALYTALVILEGYVIVPLVMGHSMELNATTVMLACVFWELVWGLPGLFLAMPLMAGLKAICRHVPGLMPWANLMSTRESEEEELARKLSESHFPLDGQD
jgi:predicted PurR-regulated permease PerM